MIIIESHTMHDKLTSQRIHDLPFVPKDYEIKPIKIQGKWVIEDPVASFNVIVCKQDDVMHAKFEVSQPTAKEHTGDFEMNREIKTDLQKILSHIINAVDYGYYDIDLVSYFAEMTGYVTDEEIKWYCDLNMTEEYTQEDWDQWYERITVWRDNYYNKED